MLLLPNGAAHLQLVVQWLAALGLDYLKLFLACSPLLVIEAWVACLLLRVTHTFRDFLCHLFPGWLFSVLAVVVTHRFSDLKSNCLLALLGGICDCIVEYFTIFVAHASGPLAHAREKLLLRLLYDVQGLCVGALGYLLITVSCNFGTCGINSLGVLGILRQKRNSEDLTRVRVIDGVR